MVVLLIGMAVTAIWLATALPSWHQQATREKEADLIFRGEQYARAIHLYQCKNGTYPPSIDLLVSQRYLRKKYKDPITNDDFVPVGGIVSTGATAGIGQRAGSAATPQSSGQVGITAVRSKSTDQAIKLYNGQQTYSQFAFETAVNSRMGPCTQLGGVGAGAGGAVGGRGGQGPGGRGGVPGETPPIVPRRGGPGNPNGNGEPPRGRGPGGTQGTGGGGFPGSGGGVPGGGFPSGGR